MGKYLATQLAILIGMILYYIFTAPNTNGGWIAITVILHVITFGVLIVHAYKDPGILPKILTNFESPNYVHIPVDRRYITG